MKFVYLIVVLFFISLNLRPSITSIGPLLDLIQRDLNMNGVAVSMLTTLPVFCMGLFSVLAIRFNRRIGIEWSLLIAMLCILAATFMRIYVSEPILLVSTALFAGIGIGIAGPLVSGFIRKHFPQRPFMASVYSVSMVIGAAVASSLSVPLFHQLNDSWQKSLSFWSILALIAAVLLVPLVKSEKRGLPSGQPQKVSVRDRRVRVLMIFFGCMAAMFYSITAWLAPIVQTMGFPRSESGYILTLFTLIQIPVSFLIPFLAGKYQQKKLWLLICCASEFIGVSLLLAGASPVVATLFLGLGAGGLFPLALLLPIQESNNAEEATAWAAMTQFVGYLLGSFGPLLVGFTKDMFHSFTPALAGMLVVIALMTLTVLQIGKNSATRIKQKENSSRSQ
ncbi:putative transporter YycB [Brevibacillus reuszeri]|uniref:MFS transporter n=1 Tax=Brevibacillus reuszeri TaxID=54915 RepID=A0A0K9YQ75_9BACL|nr:MFS transporter [Brevibacillus reuszeri]KNB70864.1 MFS transporter [Brevibacillus reuszeri]MED1857259.1 MFS transporter [Brevibacillus reuszeri]GED66913.1 putative transporter YycB [Brevibacillus reuszeri]